MSTMLIANNATRENGQFMGDQLCYIKVAYLMVYNQPDVDRVIMSMSPGNEMHFLWTKFLADPRGDGSVPPVEVVYDNLNSGDNEGRWEMWNKWRSSREIEGRKFNHYRELYLRIHGAIRQKVLCGFERGLGRRNIYEYVFYGQEHLPETCKGADWYDDTLIDHPPHAPTRDVYISPHCKTQGNVTFTFDFWTKVVSKLIDAGVSVTVGYDGYFCENLLGNPLYRKHWGDHKQWMSQVCNHKIVSCGNTGTGWLAAACGVPLLTMEPPNSQMPDHRYRQCGLRNLIEVIDTPDSDYVARRIIEEVKRVVVMTVGTFDVLTIGHIRHLQKSKSLGTKLVVALRSDEAVWDVETKEPYNPPRHRKAALEAMRCVDEVRITDDYYGLDLIQKIKPTIVTDGYGSRLPKNEIEIVEGCGGKVITTYYKDASDKPEVTSSNRPRTPGEVIELCRIASSYSVNPFEKIKLLADQFLKVADMPGEVADLGAYRGGISLVLRRLGPDRHLRVFDTWRGIPFDDELCHHKKGEWSASLKDCMAVVGTDGLTTYHEGVFPYTAEDLGSHKFSFVYVDPDIYQTVRDAIEFFWPRMVGGGKMFFDDFGWEPCAGVKKAVSEWILNEPEYSYTIESFEQLYSCVVTKK